MEKNSDNTAEELEFLLYLKIIWKYKFFILLICFLAIFIAHQYTKAQDFVYEATVSAVIPQENSSSGNLGSLVSGTAFGSLLMESTSSALLVDVIKSRRMREDIVDEFKLQHHYQQKGISRKIIKIWAKKNNINYQELFTYLSQFGMDSQNRFTVDFFSNFSNANTSTKKTTYQFLKTEIEKLDTVLYRAALSSLNLSTTVHVSKTNILKITVKDLDPQMATKIANYYVYNLDNLNQELQMNPKKVIIKFLDEALVPLSYSSPNLTFNLMVGLITGLLGGIILCIIAEFIQTQIRVIKKH